MFWSRFAKSIPLEFQGYDLTPQFLALQIFWGHTSESHAGGQPFWKEAILVPAKLRGKALWLILPVS